MTIRALTPALLATLLISLPTYAAKKPFRQVVGEQAQKFITGKYTGPESLEKAAQRAEAAARVMAEKQFIRLAKDAMSCAALTHDRCILAKNPEIYGVFQALVPGLNSRFKKGDPQVGDILGCGYQHLIGGAGTQTLEGCGRPGARSV